jgi:flagellar basal-body rod modification protein FlgD
MNANPVTNAFDPTTATSTRSAGSALGKDDFLKLLAGQMRNQDPMSSSSNDPAQMMQQMTQLSMLEQITNLANATQSAQAVALVGRTVTYSSPDGTLKSGVVDQVRYASGVPTLEVSGEDGIALGAVSEVR